MPDPYLIAVSPKRPALALARTAAETGPAAERQKARSVRALGDDLPDRVRACRM